MLLTFPLLTADEVRQAATLLHDAPWTDGRATAGDQAAQAKHNEQLPPDCAASLTLQKVITSALDRSPQFLAAALPARLFPPRFNRYSGPANRYGPHVDSAMRYTERGQQVRTDLSCTVFLAEPDAYDGGELVVQDVQGEQRIKLPAGHAVLYPGTSVHEVTPVTRGTRLASFFWIESLVRSSEQRRLLLELDNAVVALREEHGESPATIALTGAYHNLLRMWAGA